MAAPPTDLPPCAVAVKMLTQQPRAASVTSSMQQRATMRALSKARCAGRARRLACLEFVAAVTAEAACNGDSLG